MSYVSFLHQTTTVLLLNGHILHCLMSLFYIKPQPRVNRQFQMHDCLMSLFYIKPQLLLVWGNTAEYCLMSLFYIKPQLGDGVTGGGLHCLMSLFYIKPQPITRAQLEHRNCLMSLFYIKPQPAFNSLRCFSIVLCLFSTSNHNIYLIICSYSDTCMFLCAYEVVDVAFIPCKNTKKILIAMGLVLIFSLLFPRCE